jgi:glycosyltransferase involved in cell wall biosynthesis
MELVNSQPLVSAIIIFLNGEQFIEETISSIFAQTYDHWELLLVDDGSTDHSCAIAQQYAHKYPEKVKYLEHANHQNRGMSASRNWGIAHAQGDYIGFVDADDLWLPQKLEQQIAIFNTYPDAAMVYGRTQIWYSWTENSPPNLRDHFYDLGVEANNLINPPTLFLLLLQNKCQTPTTCNALMRREVFDNIGKFEESFRTMYEDQAFFSKVLLNAPVFVSDQCWAKYRQHPASCSSQAETKQYYQSRLPFISWLEHYLSTQNIQNPEVWKAFQWEKWQCEHPIFMNFFNRVYYFLIYIKNILYRKLGLSQTS